MNDLRLNSEAIKRLRKARRIQCQQIAAALGISKATYWRMEQGLTPVKKERATLLCSMLDANEDDILQNAPAIDTETASDPLSILKEESKKLHLPEYTLKALCEDNGIRNIPAGSILLINEKEVPRTFELGAYLTEDQTVIVRYSVGSKSLMSDFPGEYPMLDAHRMICLGKVSGSVRFAE